MMGNNEDNDNKSISRGKELLDKFRPMPKWLIKKRRKELNGKQFPSEIWFLRLLEKNGFCGFKRNVCLGERFFGDFVFREQKIVIEIDGASHVGKEGYDAERDELLSYLGYRVFRVRTLSHCSALGVLNKLKDLIARKKNKAKPITQKSLGNRARAKASYIKRCKRLNAEVLEQYKAREREHQRILNKKKAVGIIIRREGMAVKKR